MFDWSSKFFSTNGLDALLVYFLLITPIIVAFGSVARHLIGLKMMSLTVFLIITYVLAFLIYNNTLLSLGVGLVLVIFIYFFSYAIKKFMADALLHYFSRIAIVISLVSIAILVLISIIFKIFNLNFYSDYYTVNPFSAFLAIVLSEYFSANQIQKGYKTSRLLFWNTLIFSAIIAFFVSLHVVQSFILKYPFVVLGFVLISYFVGRYQGIRLAEVLRFKSIAKQKSRNVNDE